MGTFKAPQFLSSTDVKVAATHLVLDAQGLPVASGSYDAPFTLILPRYATSAPKGSLRLLVIGHGFLGSAENEIGDATTGSYLQDFADTVPLRGHRDDWPASRSTKARTRPGAAPPLRGAGHEPVPVHHRPPAQALATPSR